MKRSHAGIVSDGWRSVGAGADLTERLPRRPLMSARRADRGTNPLPAHRCGRRPLVRGPDGGSFIAPPTAACPPVSRLPITAPIHPSGRPGVSINPAGHSCNKLQTATCCARPSTARRRWHLPICCGPDWRPLLELAASKTSAAQAEPPFACAPPCALPRARDTLGGRTSAVAQQRPLSYSSVCSPAISPSSPLLALRASDRLPLFT